MRVSALETDYGLDVPLIHDPEMASALEDQEDDVEGEDGYEEDDEDEGEDKRALRRWTVTCMKWWALDAGCLVAAAVLSVFFSVLFFTIGKCLPPAVL